ncbi:hypothetical protein PAMP_002343 [Pampus punctatissimus]
MGEWIKQEYEIVSPYEVNHQGVYISHEITHHQRRRRRRSLTPDTVLSNTDGSSETIHFRLSGLGQDFHMELREASESLIAPGFTIQVLGKNGTKSLRAYHQNDLCFYQGSLRSRVNSSVALSTCMGMVSLNVPRVGLQEGLDEKEGVYELDVYCCVFVCINGLTSKDSRVRPELYKRLSQKVQGCRDCKCSSHD